jgi:hypothetical protein
MDADNRECRILTARLVVNSRCGRDTARDWRRLGNWRKRKRKRGHHGYEYDVLIFHNLFSFHCFWPSLTSHL